MTDPSIDPSLVSKAFDWAWAGILGLVGVIYTVNDKKHESAVQALRSLNVELKSKVDKDDIKEILERIDKSNSHIEKLYSNAEVDREKTRAFHDTAMNTMTQQHTKILEAMAGLGRK
jgi:hypothetical protein